MISLSLHIADATTTRRTLPQDVSLRRIHRSMQRRLTWVHLNVLSVAVILIVAACLGVAEWL